MDICYGRVGTDKWTQEHYETASRAAGRRARALKKLGYPARSCSLDMQVTSVGLVRMTMVDIRHPDGNPPPWPENYSKL